MLDCKATVAVIHSRANTPDNLANFDQGPLIYSQIEFTGHGNTAGFAQIFNRTVTRATGDLPPSVVEMEIVTTVLFSGV